MRVKTGFMRAGAGLALGMLVASSAITAGVGDLEQELENLREEFATAQQDVFAKMRAAETPEEQAVAFALNPWEGYRERFDALALKAEGTEVAAGAYGMVFSNENRWGEAEAGWEAFQILAYDHSNSPELDSAVILAGQIGATKDALAALHHLAEASERDKVRAGSLFAIGKTFENEEGSKEKALAYFRRVVNEYADVKGPRKSFGEMAGASLFEAERLQIGMSVPDIESTDETGTAFKLSDYKGKVVLVDFWGFW